MKWSTTTGSVCLLIALALFIHHFIICGRWLDIGDVTHHEIIELMLIEAGIFFMWSGNSRKITTNAKKAKCWVFSHPVTVLRYTCFLVGAWQLDILCATLLFPHRHERFYFLFGSLSNWEAYALFFSTLAFAFFIPEIIQFGKWLRNNRAKIDDVISNFFKRFIKKWGEVYDRLAS